MGKIKQIVKFTIISKNSIRAIISTCKILPYTFTIFVHKSSVKCLKIELNGIYTYSLYINVNIRNYINTILRYIVIYLARYIV